MRVKKMVSMFWVVALSLGLMAGCASTTELEQAQADSQRALEVAEEAKKLAEEASSKADRAQSAADSANQCCQNQQQKLDRALERMQQK